MKRIGLWTKVFSLSLAVLILFALTSAFASCDTVGTENAESVKTGYPNDYHYKMLYENVYVNCEAVIYNSDYEVVRTLDRGTKVIRVGISDTDGYYWSEIAVDEDSTEFYYIATKFLSGDLEIESGFVGVYKIAKIKEQVGEIDVLNVPSAETGKVINSISVGDNVYIIAENTDSGFYKVFYPTMGWIGQGYVSSDGDLYSEVSGEIVTPE